MLFNSIQFAVFFVVVYSLYLVLSHKWQNRMLLLASYIFYGSWDWRFLSLILISTVVDYFCGLKIYNSAEPRHRKAFLGLSLFVNLGLLGFFKYFNFFVATLESLFLAFGWQMDTFHLNIILPVGISFYTFQTLSYTIDIYRNKLKPENHFLDFALFVSFFPQLVAGPIERAVNLLPQITSRRKITKDMIKNGLWLIFYGIFLKIFVADNMAKIANQVFSRDPALLTGSESLLGIYAFAFQIFGDFAGYSSIAIGISELMGIHLMINFRQPYFVTNPSDFWRNWHISLSSWLRDYLYIPLGGNRNGSYKTYRNLFLTMLLGGLWHGAAWTFVLWGIYQGSVLIVYRLLKQRFKARKVPGASHPAWFLLRMIFMFHVTCLGWLIFRSQSLTQISQMLQALIFKFCWSRDIWPMAETFLSVVSPLLLIQLGEYKTQDQYYIRKQHWILRAVIFAVMLYLLLGHGVFTAEEFIYFQF